MAVHENWLLGIEMILQFRYLFYMITIYYNSLIHIIELSVLHLD